MWGCPGDAKDPSRAGLERRETEMEHESCDIESSGAVRMDAHDDGKPEIIKVMSGNRELCRAVDINQDGIIEAYVYFDERGMMRRRESGFGRDKRAHQISHYVNGVLVRKELETNNDRALDTWEYFEGGRLVREERDSSGDGYVDQWWTFSDPGRPECATVMSDGDGDGRPEAESKVEVCRDGSIAPKPTASVPAPVNRDAGADSDDSAPSDEGQDAGAPAPTTPAAPGARDAGPLDAGAVDPRKEPGR
jgi:hypothetical protein